MSVRPIAAILAVGALTSLAHAGSHTWRIDEIFSSSDGTIQYIELTECCGLANEIFVSGRRVTSDTTGNSFTIPANVTNPTSNKQILFGTAAFAALPGAPPVDHIIPANFFDPTGDTVRYGTNPPANNYDTFTFVAGNLPTNCKNSIQVTDWATDTFVTGPATPTNFAGGTGTIDCCVTDVDGNGSTDVGDLLDLLAQWGTNPGGPPDVNGDMIVDVADLLQVLGEWGGC